MNFFSIAPEIIYSGLKWLDQDFTLSDITNPYLEKEHIEILGQLAPYESIGEPEPLGLRFQSEQFGLRMNAVHRYFSEMNSDTSEKGFGTVHVLIKDFYVAKNQIFVRSGDKVFALYELNRPNEKYLFNEEYFISIDWSNIGQVPTTPNSMIVVSAGSSNWGHFLVDELPRICIFISKIPSGEEINIYFTGYKHYFGLLNENKIEALRIIFPAHHFQFHFLNQEHVAHFHSSNFYSPITFHPFYKNGTLARLPQRLLNENSSLILRNKVTKLFCLRQSGARSIPRSKVTRLKKLFEPLGFLFYYPEENSVINQFETFSSADIIVGVMGAGMCNTVFSRPGVTVVYIAPDGWEETFFWNLANQLHHAYYAYYCETNLETKVPEANTLSLDVKDFYSFFLRVTN